MRCAICGREKDVSELSRGIYENQVVNVCDVCIQLDNIPVMKRPTEGQLNRADQRYTVRETMERLSGMNRVKELAKDQTVANSNLGKIRFPEKAQEAGFLIENYYWILRMARRRKKYSFTNLAEITKIPVNDLENFERGILPKGYESMVPAIERALDITITKGSGRSANFTQPKKNQDNFARNEREELDPEKKLRKREDVETIKKGNFDFSRRKNLDNLTINDLAELRKERDKMKQEGNFGKNPEPRKNSEKTHSNDNDMLGDEIEF
ncbi:MAG: hypothetical protein Q7S33_03205 [Nanoarchaeota archaeon]|nr:hypothetical protein [Nanoarchaeota archaeon]